MLGTGFELKQHSLFLPLSMPSFPIIPSASAISFSQFQTKNNAIGKEATNKSNSINHQNSTVSVNKRRHSKSYLERQSAILQLSSSSSQSHFDSALARYHILFNSSFFYLIFFFFLVQFFSSYQATYHLGIVTNANIRCFLYAFYGYALVFEISCNFLLL